MQLAGVLFYEHGAADVLVVEQGACAIGVPGHPRHNVSPVDDPKRLHPQSVEKPRELRVSHSRRAEGIHAHAAETWCGQGLVVGGC